MIAWLMLACWGRAERPVPAHPDLDGLRAAVASEDRDRIVAESARFAVAERGLRGDDAARWDATRREAVRLGRAERRSDWTGAYGALVHTCATCHQGSGSSSPSAPSGHGAALAALDDAVTRADPAAMKRARLALLDDPTLDPFNQRLAQLAGQVGRPDLSPAVRSRQLGELYGYCVRCHGAQRPITP